MLTVKDDLPFMLGGNTRASRHGRVKIDIGSLLEQSSDKVEGSDRHDEPAGMKIDKKKSSNAAVPEKWYSLLKDDGKPDGKGS